MKKYLLPVLALTLMAGPVHAAEKVFKGYVATYDVYAGGVHALQTRLDLAQKGGRYSVRVESETYGMLGRLVPWRGIFSATGWVNKGIYRPETYISDTVFRGDRAVNTYAYAKNGAFKGFKQTENGKEKPPKKDVDMRIAQNSTDILSATLETMKQVAEGKGCDSQSKIFDSERTFQLIFKDKQEELLKQTKYSAYAGNSLSCIVEVKPEEGKWHKKPRGWLSIQEQGRKKGALPALWFASVSDHKTAPALPVRILLKTDYGTFVIHMTKFEEK